MRIVTSRTEFSSENRFQQQDLSIENKTEQSRIGIRRSRVGMGREQDNSTRQAFRENRFQRSGAGRSGRRLLQQMLVDRVSIQARSRKDYQSNYSAAMSTQSKVTSLAGRESVEISQQHAMEKIVGGVINKEVVFGKLEKQEDIQIRPDEKAFFSGKNTDRFIEQSRSAWQMAVSRTDIHFEDEAMDFSSVGVVTTEDGRRIDFSLDMSLNRTFLSRQEESLLVERWQEEVVLTDPIVISMDGKAPQLSDVSFEFDLDSDGEQETIHFTRPGSGFLAFDRNNDQTINDGSELFGPGTGNGFEELAAYDMDQNSWIDENDEIFSQLSVWTKDEDGSDKLISLKEAGIGAIHLDYAATTFNMTAADNSLQGQMQRTGVFLFENGGAGSIHQIDLASEEKPAVQNETGHLKINPVTIEAMPVPKALPDISSVIQGPETEQLKDPLELLQERIDKIRSQMGRLYDSINSGERAGRPRRRNSQFNNIRPDSLSLISGRFKGRNWYI